MVVDECFSSGEGWQTIYRISMHAEKLAIRKNVLVMPKYL